MQMHVVHLKTNIGDDSFLIGDDAFGMTKDVMKPYGDRGRQEKIFNYHLSRVMRCQQNAFGIKANRFRVLPQNMAHKQEDIAESVLKLKWCGNKISCCRKEER